MSDTYTFKSNCHNFTFTVKRTFVSKYNIELYSVYELMSKYHMMDYLHNPCGPAIVDHETGRVEYWFNGKKLNKEEHEKMDHDMKFNNKMQEFIK